MESGPFCTEGEPNQLASESDQKVLAYLLGGAQEEAHPRPDPAIRKRARKHGLARPPRVHIDQVFPVEVRYIEPRTPPTNGSTKTETPLQAFAEIPQVVFEAALADAEGDVSRLRVASDGVSLIVR